MRRVLLLVLVVSTFVACGGDEPEEAALTSPSPTAEITASPTAEAKGAATATPTKAPTAAPTAAPTKAPTPAPKAFAITKLDYPKTVKNDGTKHDLVVHWEGNPTFPVTMEITAPECPQGGCASQYPKFSQEKNPLVASDTVWCTYGTDVNYKFQVQLKDARGGKTPIVKAAFKCDAP